MLSRINWDALGVTTSVLCAIHCAVLPLAVATLPVFGINIIHNAAFEYGMIGLAFCIGVWALWHGFRRHHRRISPLLLFTGGMIFLIAKQIWHNYELRLLPFAIVLIIAAHALNYRLSHPTGQQCARPASQEPLEAVRPEPGGICAHFPDREGRQS